MDLIPKIWHLFIFDCFIIVLAFFMAFVFHSRRSKIQISTWGELGFIALINLILVIVSSTDAYELSFVLSLLLVVIGVGVSGAFVLDGNVRSRNSMLTLSALIYLALHAAIMCYQLSFKLNFGI